MSQYTYKPLPDSKRFIRLLSVVSAGDTISCALEDFPIDDPPPFYAVSYCWGTEPACEKIYVGSGCIALTLHLLEGIQSIHEQASPPKLWIDALCINQVDHVEKSGQIPLMSRIYGDAEKVLVWLGRGVEWSDRAMKWIPDLCEKLSLLGSRDLEDENRWQEVGIPPKNHLIWDGIRHIFSSTWFNRLWPLQEVTLAKEVEFFSGGASVKMKALLQLALDISDSDILVTPQMPTHQFNDGIIGVIAVATIRIDVPSLSTPGGAFRVLECSSRKESTEPLDYVYGVLGMLGRHISSRILVDYSASSKAEFWNVYVDLAAILLRENVYAVLGLVETKIRLPQLPSWCPNWSSRKIGASLNQGSRAGHGQRATPTRIAFRDETRLLQCAGFVLDHIAAIVPLYIGAPPYRDWKESMDMCEHVVRSRSVWPAERNIARIARTLVANLDIDTNNGRDQDYRATLVRDYTLTKYCLRYMGYDQNARPLAVTDDVFREAFKNYSTMLNLHWRGRCFFITHSGFIGLGPETADEGDAVCVLFGANTPYILRERPGYPGSYQLKGQAYVDAIMDGESMETRDPANDRDFVIS